MPPSTKLNAPPLDTSFLFATEPCIGEAELVKDLGKGKGIGKSEGAVQFFLMRRQGCTKTEFVKHFLQDKADAEPGSSKFYMQVRYVGCRPADPETGAGPKPGYWRVEHLLAHDSSSS